MELTFYQKAEQPDSAGRLMIHGRVCWNSNKVRFSTGEKVSPKDWKGDRVKGGVQFAAHINQKLNTYRDSIGTYFYTCQNVTHEEITTIGVKAEIERIRLAFTDQKPGEPKKAKPVRLPEFWNQYVEDHRGIKSDNYIKHFKPPLDHLLRFKPNVDFVDITLSFANRFIQYLMEQGLSDDSAYNALKKLRAVLKYARRSGIDVPSDFEEFPARTSHIERHFLTQEELTRLEQTVFADGFFQRQRDVFLFACYTGLRWSDLPQVQPGNIIAAGKQKLLRIIQTKTGDANPIPLSGFASRILNKYPDGLPLVTNQVYNRAIKEICKIAELDRPITVSRYYKGKRVDSSHKLFEIVSSHTARHTFATLSLTRGMDITHVQQLLGHGRLDSTMIYSHLMIADKTEAMRKAWGEELPEN